MKISVHLAAAVAGLALATPAQASEMSLDTVDMFQPGMLAWQEAKACRQSLAQPARRVSSCDTALASEAYQGAGVRSRLLYYRSSAKLAAGNLGGAISDADAAGEFDGRSGFILNQKCWTRAIANVELDKARESCRRALDIHGFSSSIVDSFALVALREQRWKYAASAYYVVARYGDDGPAPGATYGHILALTGYMLDRSCPDFCKSDVQKMIDTLKASLRQSDLEAARAEFHSLGLSEAAIVEAARPAS